MRTDEVGCSSSPSTAEDACLPDGDSPSGRTDDGPPWPLIIAGPSGVGKGTLIERLMHSPYGPHIRKCVSHTTRKARPGEAHGREYFFVDKDQFMADVGRGVFLEHAEVHGNLYGTSIEAVGRVQREGKICLMEIDVQGVRQLKALPLGSRAHTVFVEPPDLVALEKRLRGRGTEEEEKVRTRLNNATGEMCRAHELGFDLFLVNDDFNRSYGELVATLAQWYPSVVRRHTSASGHEYDERKQLTVKDACKGRERSLSSGH
ncbi:unnamed protein product [Vitrella brassicaformis CCMP3155]|uniref:guanylate kinase n=1 Tax=Vitrella brassicaformis (strain CCMP3155) TaxID=1169540 RepID=A0A0G4GQ28_VITBC|nr:unnamed protein product [Vitrella brassicaformis CCMP3155]|eukprot:CEM32487.1 unnamed protein product [Vitrella brassicaformis CCMP3155]